ncbi:GAF domain-containing sensor histidine kinase [Oscillatoria sp. FACHB-1407]|uniref:GAF domain-containing sensor histidine kinase n=1 Tax=Oscillatoria sp. FACHB-1407 TaxID=2692847 RepID=UPI0028166DB2|nr:ATP-binding protein [Oscillatoria sp. FACHB-1407]
MAKQLDPVLPAPGVDLVLVQNAAGQCLSFYWRDAEQHHLAPDQLIGKPLEDKFVAIAQESYLSRIHRILEYLVPEQFNYPFYCGDQYLVFDLNISPVLMPQGSATAVVVVGQFLYTCSKFEALELVDSIAYPSLPPSSSRYQKLLTQVAWNIRRTLDLETIWQQTVNGLGNALEASRCLLCPFESADNPLEVVAEYHQPSLESMLGQHFLIENEPYLQQALTTLKPAVVNATRSEHGQPYSLLAVPTSYKDQPNGVIILHQFDRSRIWNEVEVELIQELADQVGTGIAHATLFAASHSLAAELQKANDSLRQQHQELEEARKQAEEASRLKSEFLANTSHELRTPLNGMIGFLKLIMDGMADDPAEQSEFIEEAHRSAVHLLNIINDILDVARIEAGKMPLDLDPVKLDDLLTDVEKFTRPQAQQKHLSFEILTPNTRDEVILYGNYQRLLQVMLNLVGNAIKFTHEGGITITAEILPKKVVVHNQERPGFVKISVADTGIGVSLEKQDKLFQTFSQVDGSRTRQYGGTGLGLTISQKLVEAMGGVVNFYSMGEGLGSTVTFTVPLYQEPVMIASPLTNPADLLKEI